LAIEEVPIDVVMRKVKWILKLFRIRAIEEYLNLHNKNKNIYV